MTTNENSVNFDVKTIVIVVLVIIVMVLSFFLGGYRANQPTDNTTNTPANNQAREDIVMTVIDDERCTDCPTAQIVDQLKLVPALSKATIEEKDFSDDGVKEYLKENEITVLPAIIFNTANIEEQMNNYLTPLASGEYSLLLGATFNPFAEICDNNIDDTENGQIDCEDTTCSSKSICRVEEKAKLDVFLMGYCPFGEIAAKAIPSLQETFGDDLNIDIHFIASKVKEGDTADAFDSLHGVPEVEENIRQLCIKRDYGVNTLITYFGERYKNADNYGAVKDEPSVAYAAVGIDGAKIDACVTNGEGAKLLEEDIKLAQELNIGASPTWLANNKYTFGGIEASAIQTEYCKYNSELEGCKTTIKNTAGVSTATPECATN